MRPRVPRRELAHPRPIPPRPGTRPSPAARSSGGERRVVGGREAGGCDPMASIAMTSMPPQVKSHHTSRCVMPIDRHQSMTESGLHVMVWQGLSCFRGRAMRPPSSSSSGRSRRIRASRSPTTRLCPRSTGFRRYTSTGVHAKWRPAGRGRWGSRRRRRPRPGSRRPAPSPRSRASAARLSSRRRPPGRVRSPVIASSPPLTGITSRISAADAGGRPAGDTLPLFAAQPPDLGASRGLRSPRGLLPGRPGRTRTATRRARRRRSWWRSRPAPRHRRSPGGQVRRVAARSPSVGRDHGPDPRRAVQLEAAHHRPSGPIGGSPAARPAPPRLTDRPLTAARRDLGHLVTRAGRAIARHVQEGRPVPAAWPVGIRPDRFGAKTTGRHRSRRSGRRTWSGGPGGRTGHHQVRAAEGGFRQAPLRVHVRPPSAVA